MVNAKDVEFEIATPLVAVANTTESYVPGASSYMTSSPVAFAPGDSCIVAAPIPTV